MADGRLEAFKADIADMHIKDPASGREVLLVRAGALLMVAGPVVAIAAYFMSHSTTNTLNQNDAQVLAVAGLAVTVLGAAVFLRYSVAAFLRFWLARLIYEQRAQTDRLIAGQSPDMTRAGAPSEV